MERLYYNRAGMTWLWGVAAAIALLWPDRISGPFDGVPLDRIPEAVVVAAAVPALWLIDRRFLRLALARTIVVALLSWRIVAAASCVRDGWCVRFVPARPYAKNATGAPHAWDLRADWRSVDPACSAIATRAYHQLDEFPAWFFNLPPNDDSWPGPFDRPPGATVEMTVQGFLHVGQEGRLRIDQASDAPTEIRIDGHVAGSDASLSAGTHTVTVRTMLTGDRWRFVPTWNNHDLWSAAIATTSRPSAIDITLRRSLRWLPTMLVTTLVGTWTASAIASIGAIAMLSWCFAVSAVMALLVSCNRADLARASIAALGFAALLPIPERLRTTRGAFLVIGIPWMAFAVACACTAIGRFILYPSGHDYWMFQRFAYRIVMQGYWLEGGSPTFWFQPLYRWIAGLLHLLFGDSSAGEWYWDGACLLAGSLLAFRIVRDFAGVRWALVAAALPLATFALGTAQYLIGAGLGEISSAGFGYAAALFALRARDGAVPPALAAGVLATLAFYTRLNNLPMAFGVAFFAIGNRSTAARWRAPLVIVATIAAGVVLFAWRTWYYTGVFSAFYGTQRDLLAIWQPGMTLRDWLGRVRDSVLMVVTVNDPPRFDVYALPVLCGAIVAVAAIARAPRLRAIPTPAALFFFSSIAGAFIARGSAYPGRFSVHIIPIACALTVCAAAAFGPQTKNA
jgi:hypothetical protein